MFNVTIAAGVTQGMCMDPGDGEEPPEDLCPSGYPKVDGQCPVCIGEYNEDGTCAEEVPSSTPTSTPTSAPTSAPPTSAPPTSSPDTGSSGSGGGGDDGDGDDGGGGGGGPGTGGNTGGGSGSAAASSAPSGGSGGSTGSNSSRTPHSGYGNWIPVEEGSNCPNKYRDAAGQWWCSGGTSPEAGSAGSASGSCDPTATNYWACINSGSAGSAGSSGATSSDGSETKLTEKGDELIEGITEDIDGQLSDFEEAYTDDIDAFKRDGIPFEDDPSALKSLLISFLPVSTPCNPPSLNFFGRNYELECEYFNIFKQAFGWFLAILTAYQIWQMAIRPVER